MAAGSTRKRHGRQVVLALLLLGVGVVACLSWAVLESDRVRQEDQAARTLALKTQLVRANASLDRAAELYGAKLGRHLPRRPLARPDGQSYALSGKVRGIDGNRVQVTVNAARLDAQRSDDAAFSAIVSEADRSLLEAQAALEANVEMVGRYVENVPADASDEAGKVMPQFEVQWIRLK